MAPSNPSNRHLRDCGSVASPGSATSVGILTHLNVDFPIIGAPTNG